MNTPKIPPPPTMATLTNRSRMQTVKSVLKMKKPPIGLKPPKIIINAVEGWGKTTALAHTSRPAIIMVGDTGYMTLAGAKSVPSVDCQETTGWLETISLINELGDCPEYDTIGIDALGGLQKQAFDYVCQNSYKGSWTGFTAYREGEKNVASGEWSRVLSALENTGKTIILLSHSKIANFKNPMDADFQRYTCDLATEIYAATARWADAVLFGNFRTIIETDGFGKNAKHKGKGGTDRVMYTERRDSFDAKNRYGMPAEIDMSDVPAESMWDTIYNLIRKDN